ncbi:unnamed protein product [Strongylus vulgaris]|uniref:RING-CH-type domain-containing protein n=1 Tax=Strongylus vulgaris TaxID=40348 RepID=A0A3P7JCE9_STRVU|nr:unnamed protein product [Strongylus vulgaris]
MGDIHERCLSRWVAMSNKDQCEICQEKYARSGRTLKALKEWERPHIGSEATLHFINTSYHLLLIVGDPLISTNSGINVFSNLLGESETVLLGTNCTLFSCDGGTRLHSTRLSVRHFSANQEICVQANGNKIRQQVIRNIE